jgi:hypothetical protein
MNLSKVLQSCLERWPRRNNHIHIVYGFLAMHLTNFIGLMPYIEELRKMSHIQPNLDNRLLSVYCGIFVTDILLENTEFVPDPRYLYSIPQMYILIVEHFKCKFLKQCVAKWISDSSVNGGIYEFVQILLEATCVMAYFGFLRCSEFTILHSFDPECNVCIEDVHFHNDRVTLHLKASKTDPFA